MNLVSLTYNPLKKTSKILINGKSVSPYGEIANYLLEPFSFWAPRILDALSRELNDTFELEFTSTAIETAIMEKLADSNENCISFSTGKFAIEFDVLDRISKLEELGYVVSDAKNVGIGIFSDKENILSEIQQAFAGLTIAQSVGNKVVLKYKNSLSVTFSLLLNEVQSDGLDAKVFVSNDREKILDSLNNGDKKTMAVLVGEKDEFCGTQDDTLIFETQPSNTAKILRNFAEYMFVIPNFENICKQFLERYEGDKNACSVKMLDAIDPIVFIECNNYVIEEGHSCPITVRSFPEEMKVPEVVFRVSNDSVLRYQNQMLYALKVGNSIVEAYIPGTMEEPIYRGDFSVIKRNKITNIQVMNMKSVLGKGDRERISYTIEPANADNAFDIRIVSSNENVAIVEDNCIRALSLGKTTIRIFTPETSVEVEIEVKPYAAGIALSQETIRMLVGESKELLYKTVPNNAINNEVIYEVSDPRIVTYDGKNVKAKSFGSAEITFYNSNRTIKKQCSVEVRSTLANDKSNPFKALPIAAFIVALIAMGISRAASISFAAIGIILGILGIPYAISIAKDQFTNFGKEKEPDYAFCIIGAVINLILMIVLL